MIDPAPAPAPVVLRPPRGVLSEQFRTVGAAIRGELLAALLLMAAATLLMLLATLAGGEGVDFVLVDMVLPAILLAALAPVAVWKGESPERRTYLWSLPVDRRVHTLAKVLGGWGWLMGLVATYVVWAAGVALLTRGHFVLSVDARRSLLPGLGEGALLRDLSFGGDAWLWLVPFAGATIFYLFASIAAVASDHPWRWFAGTVLVYLLTAMLAESGGLGVGLFGGLVGAIEAVTFGRHGLTTLVSGCVIETWSVAGADGEVREHWRRVPDLRAWLGAVALWTTPGVLGVLAASLRHQER